MKSNSFSNQLWEAAAPVWEAVKAHPFLRELEAGTLPTEKFRHYVLQDYLYLGVFGRAAAEGLALAPDTETARRLLRRVSTPVERPLHADLFAALEVGEAEIAAAKPAPTNLAYMNHIEASMRFGGLAVGTAALLPCPRVYHEVGKILRKPNHPIYDIWQSSYASGLLEESVAAWSSLLDDLADGAGEDARKAMASAYLTSARYEHMFWTMGYEMERWAVG